MISSADDCASTLGNHFALAQHSELLASASVQTLSVSKMMSAERALQDAKVEIFGRETAVLEVVRDEVVLTSELYNVLACSFPWNFALSTSSSFAMNQQLCTLETEVSGGSNSQS